MMEEGLQKNKKELLQLKLQLIREWTAVFFNDQHRSVMSILSGMRLKGIQKFDINTPGHFFKEIKDIEDILAELQEGKLVLVQQWRPSKRDKKTQLVQIDFNFFNIYQDLVRSILEKIKPRLEEFRKLKQGETRKMCKNCKTERTQTEIVYLGLKCRCTNTEFVVVEPNMRENKRLQFIRDTLQVRFLNKKKQIDLKQKQVAEGLSKKKKKEENKSVKQYEQFCKKYEISSMKPENLIRSGNIQRMRALTLYGRKQNFNFVSQLKLIKQLRQKRRQKTTKRDQQFGND